MTVLAALKLVCKRLFAGSSNSRNMRSRSVSIEPSGFGYMPGDTVLTPIVEAFNAPHEPQWGNASGLRRVEEGRAGW